MDYEAVAVEAGLVIGEGGRGIGCGLQLGWRLRRLVVSVWMVDFDQGVVARFGVGCGARVVEDFVGGWVWC